MSKLLELRRELNEVNASLGRFIARNQSMAKAVREVDDDEIEEDQEDEKPVRSGEALNREFRDTMSVLDRYIKSENLKHDMQQDPLRTANVLEDRLARVVKLGKQTGQRVDPKVVSFVGSLIHNAKQHLGPATLGKALTLKRFNLARQYAAGLLSYVDYQQQSTMLSNFGPDLGDMRNWFRG